MTLHEDLKLIEEGLESLLEFRGPGLDDALNHDYQLIGRKLAGQLGHGIKRVSAKMQAGDHRQNYENSARAYNQANADYEAHRKSGNAAGMATAKNNMNYHNQQMQNSMNGLRDAGVHVRMRTAGERPQQNNSNPNNGAQQNTQQNPQQNVQQPPKKDGPWYTQQIDAARKRGDHAEVKRLGREYNEKYVVRKPGTANEAYELAEALILDILEGIENREGAIIQHKEIIQDGKPHVKGKLVETEIIAPIKKDIPNPKREQICKKASRKAEGAVSAMKRKLSNEAREIEGL